MRIGITFGCFIPLHKGHMAMISKSRVLDDITIIAVCGYDEDRGHDFIPFKDRYNLIKKIYQNDPKTIIIKIDDKKLGLDGTFTLKNWELWCNELFQNAGFNPNDNNEYIWYTGEQSYIDKISKLYNNHSFELLNRSIVPISGTIIRKNPNLYKSMINPVFYEYLVSKKLLHIVSA